MRPFRSSITHTMGPGTSQDFCSMFDLAAVDSAAEGTSECMLLETVDSEEGCKGG